MKVIKSILLIDDDFATNYLHQIYLEESNRVEEILIANSADKALELLKERIENNNPPDVIFLDINMPAKNGWEFLNEYQELVKTPSSHTKIIMLSTSDYPGDIKKGSNYPIISEYKVKPLTEDLVTDIIDQYGFESN